MPTPTEYWNLAGAIIFSVGSGGAIVWGLSSWLGKVWADRMMQADRAAHEKELESLRANLQRQNEQSLELLKNEAEIYREKHLKGHGDKVAIYRLMVDIISDLLADIDLAFATARTTGQPAQLSPAALHKFNQGRVRAYGYLAMLAPQSVMDAFDSLVDHLLVVALGNAPYGWSQIRALGIALLNQVRRDIGFDPSPIEYRGRL